MDIETALVAYLKARTGLTALIGGSSPRVYPGLVPESRGNDDNYPALTYQIISALSDVAHDGPTGLTNTRIQIVAWARTYPAAVAIRNQLHDAMTGFKGIWGTLNIGACFKADEGDMPEPPLAAPGNAAARVYGKRMDFRVWADEPVPTYA